MEPYQKAWNQASAEWGSGGGNTGAIDREDGDGDGKKRGVGRGEQGGGAGVAVDAQKGGPNWDHVFATQSWKRGDADGLAQLVIDYRSSRGY